MEQRAPISHPLSNSSYTLRKGYTRPMETVRRDLHTTTANVSSLLTRYSKLAQSASSSYSASGILKDDLTRRKQELETEIDGSLDTVSEADGLQPLSHRD